MSHEAQRTRDGIPEFATVREEAEFWDTHDLADYRDVLKPVRVRFADKLSEDITITLDPEVLGRIRSLAHGEGIGPTALIRTWIMERLGNTRPSG